MLGEFDYAKCTECGLEIEQEVITPEIGNGECNRATHICVAGEGSCPADGKIIASCFCLFFFSRERSNSGKLRIWMPINFDME